MIRPTEKVDVTARDPGQSRAKKQEHHPQDQPKVDLRDIKNAKENDLGHDPARGMKENEVAKEPVEIEKVEGTHVHRGEGRGQPKELDQKEDLAKGLPYLSLLPGELLDPSRAKEGPVLEKRTIGRREVRETTEATVAKTFRGTRVLAETTEGDFTYLNSICISTKTLYSQQNNMTILFWKTFATKVIFQLETHAVQLQ